MIHRSLLLTALFLAAAVPAQLQRGTIVVTVTDTDATVDASHHTGGAHFCLGDGSVHSLNVNGRLYRLPDTLRRIVVYGGSGDDTVRFEDVPPEVQVVVRGGAGNDVLIGGRGNDILLGGEGNDVLIGNQGNDFVFGEGGNDLIVSDIGDGEDIVDGGLGRDTVRILGDERAAAGVQLCLGDGSVRFVSSGVGSVSLILRGVENIELDGFGSVESGLSADGPTLLVDGEPAE